MNFSKNCTPIYVKPRTQAEAECQKQLHESRSKPRIRRYHRLASDLSRSLPPGFIIASNIRPYVADKRRTRQMESSDWSGGFGRRFICHTWPAVCSTVENILDDVKKAFLEDVYSWSVLIGRIRAAEDGAYSKLLFVRLCLIKLTDNTG